MTATKGSTIGIAALAVIAVSAAALTSAPARNTLAAAQHVAHAIERAASSELHAQDAGGGRPFGRGGRGGPGGIGRFGGPGGPGGPMGVLPMINRLNLTDAQRDQVRGLAESNRDANQALGERARAAHEALQAAITAETFDEGAIRAASAEVASVDADLAVAHAKLHSEILQVLTPEQRTQLKELQAKRPQRPERRGPPPPQL
jgi:protein CpxP